MIIEAGIGDYLTYIIAGSIIGFVLYSFIKAKNKMNKPPSENVKILTDETFHSTVKSGVSLVDFWAEWCGPCKVQGPIVDEVADEIGDKANICKLDIDHNQKIAGQLGIQSIPTMLLFKDGKIVEKFVGVKPKGVLLKAITAHI
jgi:thioredoxin 1